MQITLNIFIVEIKGLPHFGSTPHRFMVTTKKAAPKVFEVLSDIKGYFGSIKEKEAIQSTDDLVVAKAVFIPDKSKSKFNLNITISGQYECRMM